MAANAPTPAQEPPSWLAPSEIERLRREEAERAAAIEQARVAAASAPSKQVRSETPGVAALSWAGVSIGFGVVGEVMRSLGILGTLVVVGMIVNTAVALSRPVGGSHWVVPWGTLVVIAFRAYRGRWLAAGIIFAVWVLAVAALSIAGR